MNKMEVDTSKYCRVNTFTTKELLSSDDTFHTRFPNIFVNYPSGSMRVGNKLWTNWNKAPMMLWQTQLNFAMWCALSACGVSSEHLNYAKHPMVRSLYRFHVYYHVRRILKRLQVPLPHEAGFNAADNPYINKECFKICEDHDVPHNPMKYRSKNFLKPTSMGVAQII